MLLILSALFILTYFFPYITDNQGFDVTAWDAISAAFHYPVINKLGIDINSLYYTTFVEPSDVLSRKWTGVADLLEFMSRYMMILALIVSIYNIIANTVFLLKSLIKGEMRHKLNSNSGSLIINCILGSLAIPAFQPDAPLPIVKGTVDFLLFKTHYTMGAGFVAAFFIGVVIFITPYIWKFILSKRSKELIDVR